MENVADILSYANMTVQKFETCKKYHNKMDNTIVCILSIKNSNASICRGDSGGKDTSLYM